MTNAQNNSITALHIAVSSQHRSGQGEINTGGLYFNKAEGSPFGVEAATLMIDLNGVLEWDMECPINGKGTFSNIYQFAAAEIYAPQGSIRDRVEVSQQREQEVRSGFNTLGNWMVKVYGAQLYRLPKKGSANKTVVITVHPDYSPEWTDETADELSKAKDLKQVKAQVSAANVRLSRTHDGLEVAQILNNAVKSALLEAVEAPRYIAEQSRLDLD